MQQDHSLITKKDLCRRWGKDLRTIEKWLTEKKLKTFRDTNYFPLDYIEAIEKENLDLETANAFTLRAKNREIERLKRENATLKSRLLQVTMIATEGTKELLEGNAV